MKKILYVINVDWFFISHFLPIGKFCIDKGYEVHIACALTSHKEYLEQSGFIVHFIPFLRSKTSCTQEMKTFYAIYKVLKNESFDIIEFFTIKPVLYGGIISKFFSIPKKIFYITGLGYIFIKNGLIGSIIRNFVKALYKLAILGKRSFVITENTFDKQLIQSLHVIYEQKIKIIKGAGVDLERYSYIPENNENIVIVMASRLLKDKGIFEYLDAAKIIMQKGLNVTFELYGDIDAGNPATLTASDLEKIKDEKNVILKGFSSDISTIFSHANIVVLPSYREGLPKVLVEAAACGRAVITTNVAGCKDAIIPNTTGLLCEVKDANSLAMQIEKLILDAKLRNDMGKAGRVLAEEKFDIHQIVAEHFSMYENEK